MPELRREELSGAPPEGPAPARPRRRWLRRVTAVLAAGTAGLGGFLGFLATESGEQWLLRRIDTVLRAETGLGLRAVRLEMHPLEERIVLRGLEVGDGLLAARSVEVSYSLASLLAGRPRIHRLHVEAPVLWADAARLAQIKLKSRPPNASPSTWNLGKVTVSEGRFHAGDRAWSPYVAEAGFTFEGYGPGPGRLDGTLRLEEGSVAGPAGALPLGGEIRLKLSDPKVATTGNLSLGTSHAGWTVDYLRAAGSVEAKGAARVDLAPLQHFLRQSWGTAGRVDVAGSFRGLPSRGVWQVRVEGHDLEVPGGQVGPGDLQLEAEGQPGEVRVKELAWASEDGRIKGEGAWSNRGLQFHLEGEDVDLGPLARFVRVPPLEAAQARFTLQGGLPALPGGGLPSTASAVLRGLKLEARGDFQHEGAPAGGFSCTAQEGKVRVDRMDLDLPELRLGVAGRVDLGPQGFLGAEGTGRVELEASQVAKTLHHWHVVSFSGPKDADGNPTQRPMPMGGWTRGEAHVVFTRRAGLVLTGRVDVTDARWERAVVDTLGADVSILGSDLRVQNIQLAKAGGTAQGDLWLSWATLPPGAPQMDICVSAVRLPISEGLKAADLDPMRIQVEGLGSGWTRIHGPFAALRLDGHAQGEAATVYGLRVPSAQADYTLEVPTRAMTLRNLQVSDLTEGGTEGLLGPALDLKGQLDMDLRALTWRGAVAGRVDSGPLGLPGPRFTAKADLQLGGSMAAPFGPLTLPGLDLRLSEGRLFFADQSLEGLSAQARVEDGEIHGRLQMGDHQVPVLSLMAWQQPEGLKGALRVQVDKGTADTSRLARRMTGDLLRDLQLQVDVDGLYSEEGLSWQGLAQGLEARLPGSRIALSRPANLTGSLEGARVDLELAGAELGATGKEGARLGVKGFLPFGMTRPMELRLAGSTHLASLKEIADRIMEGGGHNALQGIEAAGTAEVDLTLGGPFPDPRLDGRMSLRNGSLRMGSYQQTAEAVSFDMDFKGRDISISEEKPLTGRLASGALSAWGGITWSPLGLSDYRISTRLRDFQFRDLPEGFELDGSLEATLRKVPGRGDLLSGSLNARRMLYRSEIQLTDFLFGAPSAGLGTGLDPEDPLDRIGLDLDLKLQQPWQFDTNLLKLQGRPQGSFRVQGTLARPGLRGKMELVPGGRLTNILPAGDVVVERGVIDFPSADSLNPVLDLLGRVDVPPFVVSLGIRGALDQLNVSPTSMPSLRQDEILGILINPSLAATAGTLGGGNTGTVSQQGLANASSGLVSGLAIAGLQEQVRQTLNLDRVNFALRTGTGTPEMSLTAGKTLEILDRRVPLLVTNRRVGKVTTWSGQSELRFGDFVFQLGLSHTPGEGVNPSGELRWTWSPK